LDKVNVIQKKTVAALGNVCRCCGETRIELLTLAHLINNGAAEKRKYGNKYKVYKRIYSLLLTQEDISKLYGVECYNCNSGSYRNYNICPHIKPVMSTGLSYIRRPHKDVILKYGGECALCNETELGFLTIDHKEGGGRKEVREKFGGEMLKFYRFLRDSTIREDIQILCWNCNCSKSN
jgi:hypothetical protein